MTTPAQTIQDALQVVAQFRQHHANDPALAQSIAEVKRFQARRYGPRLARRRTGSAA